MTSIIFVLAGSGSLLAAVAIVGGRMLATHHRRSAMADAALADVYARYRKEVRDRTGTYMLHTPPPQQSIAEFETLIRAWAEPEARGRDVVRRPFALRALLTRSFHTMAPTTLLVLEAVLIGLLALAIHHRAGWWLLMIPALNLVGVLSGYKWPTLRGPSSPTTRSLANAALGTAVMWLAASTLIQHTAWWLLLIPASGLSVITSLTWRPLWSQALATRSTIQIVIGGAAAGLAIAALLVGGAWLVLLLPAIGLLTVLVASSDRLRATVAQLADSRRNQEIFGTAAVGLAAAPLFSGGSWWIPLGPTCGIIYLIAFRSRRDAAPPDEHQLDSWNGLVNSSL